MKEFSNLILKLDRCAGASEERVVLRDYFSNPTLSRSDLAWSIYLLLNGSSKVIVKGTQLRAFAQELSGVRDWLFEECLSDVGDLAETIALIIPSSHSTEEPQDLAHWMTKLLPLSASSAVSQVVDWSPTGTAGRQAIEQAWKFMDEVERSTFNKILTGTLRSKVKPAQIVQALGELFNLDRYAIASRLNEEWLPSDLFFSNLIALHIADVELTKPYPFIGSRNGELDGSGTALVTRDFCFQALELSDWIVEWKWHGLAAQLIKRKGKISIWTKGEELITDLFPELLDEAKRLPDGSVLVGEILGFKDADVLPYHMLTQRMNKKLSKQLLEDTPVIFMAHDLLEENEIDITSIPLETRRERLAFVLSTRSSLSSEAEFEQLSLFAPCQLQLSTKFRISPMLQAENIEELKLLFEMAQKMNVLGLILKRKDSSCKQNPIEELESPSNESGRIESATIGTRTCHISWNLPSKKCDAVLISAQPAGGKRSGLFTDYTFGLWKENELLPVARVTANLGEDDLLKVDKFIRENTVVKFGPVASVKAKLVFELECDAVLKSSRHKAGLTMLHPRILRLRSDLPPSKASSLDDISQFF